MFLQIGSMAVDPTTGHVKAWLGGINFKHFQYDHVTTPRQVGSTFKPFIYSTAINHRSISPCYEVFDVPHTIHRNERNFHIPEDWTPKNSHGTYTNRKYSLMEALRKSKNTVSVYLMKELGDVKPVIDLLRGMGLDVDAKYSNNQYVIPRVPALCLGAADLSVIDMTGAYTTYANNGHYNEPTFITKIEDRFGNTIYTQLPSEQRALPENVNYIMIEMLRYAMGNRGKLRSDVGGKTGTTNDHVDGWFMGVTPDLVVGTWVGGEHRWIRFLSIDEGQGARMAKPFFIKFMERLEKDSEVAYNKSKRFFRPPGDIGIELDCSQYEVIPEDEEFEVEENEDFGDDIFADEIEENEFFEKGGSEEEDRRNR